MGRRFMGAPHQAKVSVNPLHVTAKIEHAQRCNTCQEVLHRDAFVAPTGTKHPTCRVCRIKAALAADSTDQR